MSSPAPPIRMQRSDVFYRALRFVLAAPEKSNNDGG
jgi:hypothetical protein